MKYKGILLKLSGEALAGSELGSIKPEKADFIIDEIREALKLGVRIGIVLGGGNIYRGNRSQEDGIEEETAHWMGMLAITINCFAFHDLLKKAGVPSETLSALGKIGPIPAYTIDEGRRILDEGKVLLLSGGTGKPFVSSDSGAALRASELGLDVIFKSTKVDGVYDADPIATSAAKKFDRITFDKFLDANLKVMDREAVETAKKNGISIIVFKMEKGNIKKALLGEDVGTVIYSNYESGIKN